MGIRACAYPCVLTSRRFSSSGGNTKTRGQPVVSRVFVVKAAKMAAKIRWPGVTIINGDHIFNNKEAVTLWG